MCTVTYFPLKEEGFIVTHSRDESINRLPALAPTTHSNQEGWLHYPTDQQAGGTWMVQKSNGTVVALLNGGFKAHVKQAKYQKSRGLLLLEMMQNDLFLPDLPNSFFQGIEPFTLVYLHQHRLYHLVWDEQNWSVIEKDVQQPHIWSSSTLYSPAMVAARNEWWVEWLQLQQAVNQQDIIAFHKSAGSHLPLYGLLMRRPDGMQTVSITSFAHCNKQVNSYYEFIHSQKLVHQTLTLPEIL